MKNVNELIKREMNIRDKWRKAIATLSLIEDEATEHNSECNKWWEENYPNEKEVVVASLGKKLIKQKLEPAKHEAYLCYGLEIEDITLVDMLSGGML
jgi:hypothetical protein